MIEIERKLRVGFEKLLPGANAHRKVMNNRKGISDLKDIEETARKSAVLILIYPRNGVPHIVLNKRHAYDGAHSNQIGLPGGKVETSDSSLLDTALREANEELNIQSDKVKVIGQLTSLYIPPSNFIVSPFVGIHYDEPKFVPDSYEVQSVLEIPLNTFLRPNSLINTRVKVGDEVSMKVKAYDVSGQIIWGATCMIIKELSELING